jgi:arginine exporter protein ArgO
VDTTAYKLLMLLHITAIVVAFAPASVHTALGRQLAEDGSPTLQRFATLAAANSMRIHGTALILAGLFGIGLILASDEVWEFSDGWISAAFLVWIAMNGVVHGLIVPNERKLGSGDATVRSRLDLGGLLITVLFFVMLYLMIWKPGA